MKFNVRINGWSDAAIAELEHLWPIASARAIGQALGTTHYSVLRKAHSMDLPRKENPVRCKGLSYPCISGARAAFGTEPLPPMHPISWGAIAL